MKTRRAVPNLAAGLMCLAFGGAAFNACAQSYDPAITVPVTFYDFRADRSNPEFEVPHGKDGSDDGQGLRTGMVADRLDADGKPKTGSKPYLNHGIRFWFRDWGNLGSYKMADSNSNVSGRTYLEKFRPLYKYNNGNGFNGFPPKYMEKPNDEWDVAVLNNNNPPYIYHTGMTGWPDGTGTAAGGDSVILNTNNTQYRHTVKDAYQNKVVPSNLTFTHTGAGVYRYENTSFFPIANLGWNAPGSTNRDTWTSLDNKTENYSFTMEMVWKFKMADNLTFSFLGDDDVWVFINGKLAMDLGGIHKQKAGSINLNDLRVLHGLKNDSTYDFHMFYCERHTEDSKILITTNLITARARGIDIKLVSDTIKAGETVLGVAEVKVDTGNGILTGNDIKGKFQWWVKDTTLNIHPSEKNILNGADGQRLTLTKNNGEIIDTSKTYDKLDSIKISAQKAYTNISLRVRYVDPMVGTVDTTIFIYVKPGDPHAIFIESSPDSSRTLAGGRSALRTRNPVDTITINGSMTTHDQFYGIVRDRFDNWVQPVSAFSSPRNPPYHGNLAWSLAQITGQPPLARLATILTGGVSGQQRGRGSVTKVNNPDPGMARVNLAYQIPTAANGFSGTFTTSAVLVIEGFTAANIRVGVLIGGTFDALAYSSPPSGFTNKTINMKVGGDTTFYVQILRSDNNQWVYADAVWGSGGAIFESAPSGTTPWVAFTVNAKGAGSVSAAVSGNPNMRATVPIVVGLGDPVSMRFYNLKRTDKPDLNFLYSLPPQAVTVRAGQYLPIVPKLFTDYTTNVNMWDSASSRDAAKFSWSFAPGSPTNDSTRINNLTAVSGRDSVSFRSTVAHETYKIIGTYSIGGITVPCSLSITVLPDYENPKLVIEPDANAPLQNANKLHELVFVNSEVATHTPKSVYAVLRDKWGNFICFSGALNPYTGQTTKYPDPWHAFTINVIEHEDGVKAFGERIVIPVGANSTKFYADGGNGTVDALKDTITVSLLTYSYDSLIVAVKITEDECDALGAKCVTTKNSSGDVTGRYRIYVDSDTLEINSNQDTTFYVLGRIKSEDITNGLWEPVTANWGSTLGSALSNAPSGAGLWTISPADTGRGQIRASRGGLGTTLTGTLNIRIVVGPPTGVVIEILDPNNLKAGQPIKGAIHYTNRAGIITVWNDAWGSKDAFFGDILGYGDPRPFPKVGDSTLGYLGITPHGAYDYLPSTPNAALNLVNKGRARDTVEFIIYLAGNSYEHQIRIYHPNPQFGGTVTPGYVTALSNRFIVKAGDLSKVEITVTDPNNPVDTLNGRWYTDGDPDSVTYSYKKGATDLFTSVGYDEWGNEIGRQESDWHTRGNIPPPSSDTTNISQVLYDSKKADDVGEGWIIIVAVDENGDTLKTKDGKPIMDSIFVKIIEMVVDLPQALTLDSDGNGYLDGIKLTFNKAVKLAGSNDVGDKITVSVSGDIFSIAGVEAVGADSLVWLVRLNEFTEAGLQTGKRPDVSFKEGFFTDVMAGTVTASDGAAPVIYEAKKYFAQSGSEQDRLEVTFSENVENQFSSKGPGGIFYIWQKAVMSKSLMAKAGDPCGDKILDTLTQKSLGKIENVSVSNPTTLVFYLGKDDEKVDLSTRHFINIRTYSAANDKDTSYVKDNVSNTQSVYCNRIVPLTYGNNPPMDIKPIPNPSSPDPTKVIPGVLEPWHNDWAADYVKKGGGGSIVRIPGVKIPKPEEGKLRCQIKVYDLVGNLVHAARTNDFAGDSKLKDRGGEYVEVDLYWNGYNSKKMKVAPGTYRLIVQFDYENSELKSQYKGKNKFTAPIGVSK